MCGLAVSRVTQGGRKSVGYPTDLEKFNLPSQEVNNSDSG